MSPQIVRMIVYGTPSRSEISRVSTTTASMASTTAIWPATCAIVAELWKGPRPGLAASVTFAACFPPCHPAAVPTPWRRCRPPIQTGGHADSTHRSAAHGGLHRSGYHWYRGARPDRGQRRPALCPNGSNGIEHVVVLMMENRSFDHFLSWLPGADGRNDMVYLATDGSYYPNYPLAPDFQGCEYLRPVSLAAARPAGSARSAGPDRPAVGAQSG